ERLMMSKHEIREILFDRIVEDAEDEAGHDLVDAIIQAIESTGYQILSPFDLIIMRNSIIEEAADFAGIAFDVRRRVDKYDVARAIRERKSLRHVEWSIA